MPYINSNLIARQHGWGDDATTTTAPVGQSVGGILGGLLQSLLGSKTQPAPTVVPSSSDNTTTYLGLAAAAGIGLYLWKRKKR